MANLKASKALAKLLCVYPARFSREQENDMLASRLWFQRMTIVDREAPESSRGALRGENEGIMRRPHTG